MKNKDIINFIKESIKELKEGAWNDVTLTHQGSNRTRAVAPAGKDPYTGRIEYPYTVGAKTKNGMMEQSSGAFGMSAEDLAATYSLERLQSIRDEVMGDMEQEAEPEGGNIADMYADQLHGLDQAIAIKQGGSSDKSYTEVVLSRLAGPNDAKEYDNEKHQLIIYPGLGSLQYKSRSTQEIVFTHIEGKPAFVRAFGMTRSYDELKKVLPELGQMGNSSYSGFMNVGVDDEPIPVDLDTAQAMIDAMKKGREAEAGAQSAFYTRQPGTGGTGIDERINEQSIEDLARKDIGHNKGIAKNAIKRIQIQRQDAMDAANQAKGQGSQAISQQEEQLAELNQQVIAKKQEYAKNKAELEESTIRFHEMPAEPEFEEEKAKLLERIYELKEIVQKNQEEMTDLRKQRNELNKTKLDAVSAQTSAPSVTKPFAIFIFL